MIDLCKQNQNNTHTYIYTYTRMLASLQDPIRYNDHVKVEGKYVFYKKTGREYFFLFELFDNDGILKELDYVQILLGQNTNFRDTRTFKNS